MNIIRNTFIFGLLFVVLPSLSAFAYDQVLAKKAWGIETTSLKDLKCPKFNLPNTACIGNAICSSDGNQGIGVSKGNKPQHAVLLLIAYEIADHGAKFCATQAQAFRNTLSNKPWLSYYLPAYTEVSNEIYYAMAIDYFHCQLIKSEHNAFYGVVDFTADGHGVITQPMVARPYARNTREADIDVATFGNERVLCLSGYHPEGDKCVLNDGIANQNQNNNQNRTILPCKGWEGLPNSASYLKYYTKGMNCYQYRCKDEAQGFSSNTNLTCVACNDSVQKGVNSDGVCITCEGTQIFDKETKQCRMSVEVTKQELAYGKTGSPALNVSDQCWTKLERSEYVRCVERAKSNSNSY